MIEAQQIIVLLPLFLIIIPANAAFGFSLLAIIAAFDFYDVGEKYDSTFDL